MRTKCDLSKWSRHGFYFVGANKVHKSCGLSEFEVRVIALLGAVHL